MTFRAAVIQLGPASPTIGETADRIVALVAKAAKRGAKLAALPELALTPYFAAAVQDVAKYASVAENEAAIKRISKAAKEGGIALNLPFAEQVGDDLYNSTIFIDARGRKIGTFRKVHIPGQKEPKEDGSFTIMEKRYFKPGDKGFGVFNAGVAKVGGLICYDRRFPESYRSLVSNGAEVIMVGYNTPVTPGQTPPATLSKARRASELAMCGGAYSTASYVLGAGKAGREDGVTYIGGSLIIAPDGEILARAKTQADEVIFAEIDLSKVAALRKRWSFQTNRRPDAYVLEPAA
jgi:predicted amidohydrolase